MGRFMIKPWNRMTGRVFFDPQHHLHLLAGQRLAWRLELQQQIDGPPGNGPPERDWVAASSGIDRVMISEQLDMWQPPQL